jgi:hypothetical protein
MKKLKKFACNDCGKEICDTPDELCLKCETKESDCKVEDVIARLDGDSISSFSLFY